MTESQAPLYAINNHRVTNEMVSSSFTAYMAKTFGEYLRDKLTERNIRPAELARRSGVTKQNISRLLNDTPHYASGALPKVEVGTVEKLAKALQWDIDEARLAAGFAPLNKQIGKPQTLSELISILETLGVENIHFADDDAMRNATPEDLQAALDAVKIALEVTISRKRQLAPTNDAGPNLQSR